MRLWRLILGAAALVLATACAALTGLALLGRVASRLDALSNLDPLFLAGALAAAALSLAGPRTQRTPSLAMAAASVLACAWMMVPEALRPTGPTAASGAPGQIKVVEFNVWRDNPDPRAVVAWLKAEDPDFAILVESTPRLRTLIEVQTGWAGAGFASDTMIFSRRHFARMNRPQVVTPLTWVNATYDNATGPIEVVVTHIPWPTDPTVPSRNAALAAIAGQLPRRRMILAGDFNATPWSAELQRDDKALGLTRRDRAVATFPANRSDDWRWPAPFPFLPIDHLYAGPGWATVSVKRGPRLGSDHYPIVVTLAPVAGAEP